MSRQAEVMQSAGISALPIEAPIEPRPAGIPIPLTPLQARWWQIFPERRERSKRLVTFVRASGRLDTRRLVACITSAVHRHEALRTRIVSAAGTLEQCVDPLREMRVPIVKVAGEDGARQFCEAFADQSINLSIGPLFEARVLRLSATDHVLILGVDHMVGDAYSCGVLNREIWTLYHEPADPSLAPRPRIQFADYAVWLKRTQASWRTRHEEYWRSRLAGVPAVTLPYDHEPVAAVKLQGAQRYVPFGKGTTDKLRELARQEGSLLPLVFLAIYAAGISSWCDRSDFVLAFVAHGRDRRPELKSMIGFLATFRHLRIVTEEGDTFLDLLRRVIAESVAAYRHHDFDRAPGIVPECSTEVFFNWLPSASACVANPAQRRKDVSTHVFPVKVERPNKFYPYFSDSPAGACLNLLYRPDLFEHVSIARFIDHLRWFAERAAEDPRVALRSLRERFRRG